MLELAMRFYVASASWLNQIALAGDDFKEMTAFQPVNLPLPTQVGNYADIAYNVMYNWGPAIRGHMTLSR